MFNRLKLIDVLSAKWVNVNDNMRQRSWTATGLAMRMCVNSYKDIIVLILDWLDTVYRADLLPMSGI